ncbi:MAG: serine hydrolase domain-containing protein, partial [Bacteroidia bacterium]
MRKFIFVLLWFSCMSCGQSSSGRGYNFDKPDAPVTKNKIPSKYRDLAYRLDTMFSKMAVGKNFNGAVIVSKNGEVVYQKAFGYADKEHNIPLTDTTLFQLASVSKVITATSVLMLLEKGLIKLDDKFSDYFPEFPYPNITIQHLLSHRSGLPNYIYFLNDLVSNKTTKLSNSEVLKLMAERQPKVYLKPDKAFNYCNTNYALLALLVEKISQRPFSEFLAEEIFT